MTPKEKSELQKEIVDYLGTKIHGRLLLAPRIGKTKIIIDIIKKEKPDEILWVTPSAKLADEDIPAEFIKWKAKKYLGKLTTCTYASLHNMKGFYNLIILDEDQHLTENNAVNLLDNTLDCVNILSMTGTSTQHRDKLELYSKLGLKVLYELPISEAVDINLLADYQINVVQIEPIKEKMKDYNKIEYLINKNHVGEAKLSKDKTKLIITGKMEGNLSIQKGESKFGTGEMFRVFGKLGVIGYVVLEGGELKGKLNNGEAKLQISKGVVHYPQPTWLLVGRSRAIGESELKTEVAKKMLGFFGRKLMFCTTTAQADKLSNHTYHSKCSNESLLRFQNKDIEELVMVNKGGTGFTYKEIDHLIIVQCDSDKNGLTSQKICRTLLSQGKYKANIWILCVMNTRDEVWIESTLNSFDKDKIKYVKFNDLIK